MKSRAQNDGRRQGPLTSEGAGVLRRMIEPMVAGMLNAKQTLTSWVHELGLAALEEVFAADAERLVGPKGKHRGDRSCHHWGSTWTAVSFGGRMVSVRRPRVRTTTNREVPLPAVEQLAGTDPLHERVVQRLLLGVSTRGYQESLERPVAGVPCRGASKSAASRRLIAGTRQRLASFLSRDLKEVPIVAMMLDGLDVAGHAVVVALGISREGKKMPLGLWLGSTENATICTALVQDLLARGLRIEGRLLCIVDGGKGIRKALLDVFGDQVLIQRCQLHKRRNISGHLPKSRQRHVDATMREAYRAETADVARRQLRALLSWLERNGHDEAAGSLREGMEETLTVLKLGLPPTLRRSLATTNGIENLMGSIRRVTRNVKRWRGPDMVRRWTGLGIVAAQERFHRIKGYRDIPALAQALANDSTGIDNTNAAA